MDTTHTLWLGSRASYEAYLEANTKILAAQASDQELPEDTMLDVQGSVGIINIAGSLVAGAVGPWGQYFGVTGYDDIRQALVSAIKNPQVGSIMLNFDSGGGQVSGVHDTAQLIARVNKIKPVITYTGASMHSAALWLGASSRKIVVSSTAMYGSLGILMTHRENSKMLADAGIKYTVIRAGAFKALASPYEPLSDAAKAQMTEQAQFFYNIFLDYVAEQRGMTAEAADKAFGQGREFIGSQGVTTGLADEVGSFEDAYKAASDLAAKTLKTAAGKSGPSYVNTTNNAQVTQSGVLASASLSDNPSIAKGNSMATQSLTAEQLAAIAAGVDLSAESEADKATRLAAEKAVADKAAADAAAAKAVADAGAAATSVEPSAMVVLQGMLTTAQNELTASKVENAALKAQAEAATSKAAAAVAELAPFVEIARSSVKTMGLHFGVTAEMAAALPAAQVLAEHGRLSTVFKEKFKVGQVAASGGDKSDKKADASNLPLAFNVATKPTAK